MIGTVLGAGIKVGSAIIGGFAKRKAARNAQRVLKNQMADNQAWYDRRYNEDGTQRADAQRAMQMTRSAVDKLYNRTAGAAAVTGASDESVAAQKAAGTQAVANTAGSIAAASDARKDRIENQYLNTKNNLQGTLHQSYTQQGVNTANANSQAGDTAAQMVATDGLFASEQATIDAQREAEKQKTGGI